MKTLGNLILNSIFLIFGLIVVPTEAKAIGVHWFSLESKTTRFPFYVDEPEPLDGADSRACHDSPSEKGADKYFIGVADTSTSEILWPSRLGECTCPKKDAAACVPSCDQRQCGKKILIRCRETEKSCLRKYRGHPVVVMIRDVCPKKHLQNIKSSHCQGGNHIDLYRELYRELTGSYSGKNLEIDFSSVDPAAALGPSIDL